MAVFVSGFSVLFDSVTDFIFLMDLVRYYVPRRYDQNVFQTCARPSGSSWHRDAEDASVQDKPGVFREVIAMKYLCPVCGYDQMEHPPQDYAICLCCRTEFGVSDFSWTHEQLRQNWIARGAKWGSSYALPSDTL
jgi:hypothetical protein